MHNETRSVQGMHDLELKPINIVCGREIEFDPIGVCIFATSPVIVSRCSCPSIAILAQMRRLFAKFDEHRDMWAGAVRCLAHVDALLSLAEVSSQPGFSRPQFYEGNAAAFIRLKNARHPCLAQTYQGGEYIPNDAALGTVPAEAMDDTHGAPNMLLLTGPNMGGKSTLLRQTCLVAILAQVRITSQVPRQLVVARTTQDCFFLNAKLVIPLEH